ncbi:Glyoxal reductase [Penicillium diatomitis]|uniref:D-xylose reductase [NAD(P)H] n=1 Tax=Penicillium diatomitis TaxID=2819901 RepID=A0A9X0BTC8_9EURO|nr:Glyoxal reductase [Penicillium diatomitis]KAJ5483100.1 Glyoxal reductase [Penicillium diatomitis]
MSPKNIYHTLEMPNSIPIPQLGFGVYQSPESVCTNSCLTALKAGYRHLDTAQYYGNEVQVGQAVRQSDLSREEIFLTTKVLVAEDTVEKTLEKCIDSVSKLDPASGYVDLFLIHSPNAGPEKRKVMWQALEKLQDLGKTKSIGVSNFGIKHIEELKGYATVWPPHVNQIELHPWLQQREIVDWCHRHGVIVEAYCPLVRNMKAKDPTLVRIAQKHSVSVNQVLIRYSLQKGWVPLPKSDTPERIVANAKVFDFELDGEDMAALDGLDQGPAGAIVQAVDN